MRSPLLLLSIIALGAGLAGCNWVKMAPGANQVRVLTAAPQACVKRGEIDVAVKHNIAFIERNPLRVREELETLARNEAPGLQANAIHALSQPFSGTQRFAAWACPN